MQMRKAASKIHEFCSLGRLGCSGSWLKTELLLLKWLINACVPVEDPSAGPPGPEQAAVAGR